VLLDEDSEIEVYDKELVFANQCRKFFV